MIKVQARLAHGRFQLTVNGHEGGVQAGRVCAAVSAITQTALLGLEQVAHAHPDLVSIDITDEESPP